MGGGHSYPGDALSCLQPRSTELLCPSLSSTLFPAASLKLAQAEGLLVTALGKDGRQAENSLTIFSVAALQEPPLTPVSRVLFAQL